MVTTDDVQLVGPVLRGMDSEIVDAVIEAIEIDNPDSAVVVDDQGGYVRVGVEHRCRLSRGTLEEVIGRSFPLSELEPVLSGFAGRVRGDDSEFVWYLQRGGD